MLAPSSANSAGALHFPKMLAGSAADGAAPKVAAYAKGKLHHRRNHNDAFRLVEQVLRNPVGNIHDLLEHLAAGGEAFLFPAMIGRKSGASQQKSYDRNPQFSHDATPNLDWILAPWLGTAVAQQDSLPV